MRLYIKFFAFVLATASLQQFCLSDQPSSALWFGLRCEMAYMTNNQQWQDALVNEAHDLDFGTQTPIIVNASS